MLLDSKSNLAKLMATENIIVEQRKAATAHFNLKTRTLVIPILKSELSSNLYDLFVGHEVGHALNTPEQGWHDSITDCGVNRSILNVCEDVRIEKLIRRKFPGLKTSFIKAYRELMEQDFFGIKGYDLNTLKLIDRINLHTKAGASLGIKFNVEEHPLLVEAEDAETFEQTVEVAKKIQQYMKEQKEKQKQEEQQMQPQKGDKGEPLDADDDGESGDEYEDDDSDYDTQSGPDDFDDEDEQSTGSDETSGDGAGTEGSFTDENFRKNEKELYDGSNDDLRYANIPNVNFEDFTIEYKKLYKEIREIDSKVTTGSVKLKQDKFVQFRKSAVKVVSYLTKEFELRKNAEQLKRASIAKTGDLNMSRIFAYQFADDIFKKISVVPNGKSHGLVLFLDWSGSMRKYMDDTIRQLLSLALFCKNVQIPFEVYAFSSQYTNDNSPSVNKFKEGDLMFNSITLLNILSSKMTQSEFNYAANFLLSSVFLREEGRWDYHKFLLGGTPLNETMCLAMDIVPKFQTKNKLQVVNTVFLTDGEGHALTDIVGEDYMTHRAAYRSLVIRDPKTHVSMKAQYDWSNNSKAFLHLLKQRTHCNVIGFRILSNHDFNRYIDSNMPGVQVEEVRKEFRANKSYVVESFGFDEYYLLKADSLSTEEEELVVSSTTTRGLVSSFKKFTKNNIQNRVVLNRFIGLIS